MQSLLLTLWLTDSVCNGAFIIPHTCVHLSAFLLCVCSCTEGGTPAFTSTALLSCRCVHNPEQSNCTAQKSASVCYVKHISAWRKTANSTFVYMNLYPQQGTRWKKNSYKAARLLQTFFCSSPISLNRYPVFPSIFQYSNNCSEIVCSNAKVKTANNYVTHTLHNVSTQ